jgi:hypothetical protein
MRPPTHIFIVGSFRSGTTLLRTTLNRSSEITITGETHFLGHLFTQGYRNKFNQIGDLSTDKGIRKIVDYLYSDQCTKRNHWKWIEKNIDQEDFLQKLLKSERTDRALFDLVMIFTANGKAIRGEKTPAHIYYVPTLMSWFPEAKVIHTIRDPRAIFVSENQKVLNKENLTPRYRFLRRIPLALKIYVILQVLVSWLWIAHLHQRYQHEYPDRYYLSRYEDLVSDPKKHLRNICDFLGVDFTEEMLDQGMINSSFSSQDNIQTGFDTSPVERWRTHLHPVLNKWFVFWCKKYLLEFGYQTK